MVEVTADTKKDVEAILFAAGRTVKQEEIERLLDINTPGLVKEIVNELKQEYSTRDTALLLIEEGDGWKLTIKEQYLPVVQKINPHTELSKAVMETLAVISWKQPIMQSRVVEIRSNKAYDHIKELIDLGYISKEKYGRTYMIKITQKFLDYFDLPNPEAARKVFRDFKDEDLQKKVSQFKEGATPDDEGHLGDLKVYDAGEEQDTYADRRALETKHEIIGTESKLGGLDVYEEKESDSEVAPEPEVHVEEKETEEEGTETSAESEGEEDVVTDEDKARKMAEELLAEDQPKEEKKDDEAIPERELHPELENYLNEGKEGSEAAQETGQPSEETKDAEQPEAEPEGSPAEDIATTAEETEEKPAEEPTPEAPAEEETSDEDYEKKRKALEETETKKEAEPEAPAEEQTGEQQSE